MAAFEQEIKQLRELEAIVEMQRAAKREIRDSSTKLVDPMLRGRGVTMGTKRMGRPRGSSLRIDLGKSHKRQFASPVLRRDPIAQEKLAMILFCDKLAKEQGLTDIKLLKGPARRIFEKTYHYPFTTVLGWAEKKASLCKFVGANRIGKHGLRPCGLRGRNMSATGAWEGELRVESLARRVRPNPWREFTTGSRRG